MRVEKTLTLARIPPCGWLSPDHIRQYLLTLVEAGKKPFSVHQAYRSLKTFYNWLVNESVLEKSPMDHIKPPKLPNLVVKTLTTSDINKILLICSGHNFLSTRNRAIFLVFLDTGLRLSELANISLKDIDFNSGSVIVLGKGAKERRVRLGTTALKAVLKYLLLRDDQHEALWVTEERRPITAYGIQIMIDRLFKRAEITGVKTGAHTIRHTAAINYLRNSGDQFTLQIMLGHSSLNMTRRYVTSLSSEDMANVHKRASPVDNLKLD